MSSQAAGFTTPMHMVRERERHGLRRCDNLSPDYCPPAALPSPKRYSPFFRPLLPPPPPGSIFYNPQKPKQRTGRMSLTKVMHPTLRTLLALNLNPTPWPEIWNCCSGRQFRYIQWQCMSHSNIPHHNHCHLIIFHKHVTLTSFTATVEHGEITSNAIRYVCEVGKFRIEAVNTTTGQS